MGGGLLSSRTVRAFKIAFATANILVPIWYMEKILIAKNWPYVIDQHTGSLNRPFILLLASVILYYSSEYYEGRLSRRELRREREGNIARREFLDRWVAGVCTAMDSVSEEQVLTVAQRADAIREILKAVRAIVGGFYDDISDLLINANYMKAYNPPQRNDPLYSRARQFVEDDREPAVYFRFLDLKQWAEPEGQVVAFALPVEDPNHQVNKYRMLPGAPYAFAFNIIQVIPDTQELDWYFGEDRPGRNVSRVIRLAQEEYFRDNRNRLKSFASLPIIYRENAKERERVDGVKGVLNVQSNQTHIFGRDNEHKPVLAVLLRPFQVALGHLT